MSSPVLKNNTNFQERGMTNPFNGEALVDSSGTMTIENTIQKTAMLFVVLLGFAAFAWLFLPPIALLPAAIVGLVLGLVNAFKKEPSVPLILAYGAVEGIVLGLFSTFFEAMYPGIVIQAVLATLSVFAVVLVLFANGKVRASKRATQIWLVATTGYILFSLINFVLMLTGSIDGMYGLRGVELGDTGIALGIPLGILAIFLASYSLVMDFTLIQNGARNRIPERYGWQAAFGLAVTLIWLYLEIVRLIGIIRR